MGCRILVVEDEIFVAVEIETVVEELGHNPIGIAADSRTAMSLAPSAEVALVDLNLLDGPTGPELGRALAEQFGVAVVFMTANPSQLGAGIPGTIGVLPKPVADHELKQALTYAVAMKRNMAGTPPARLRLFNPGNLNQSCDEASMNG